jgi:hypothetical protein
MALPASGPISFNNINVELGVSGTTQASLGQTSYRTLAGVASGQISMSNFYGKANQFAFTISSNTANANLASLATAAGWNGTSKVVATIGSGVYVYSTSTGTPALTINGSFPNGVELVNSGLIYGMGGAGGAGAGPYGGSTGASGGNALTVSVAVSITNNGTISGGGGGGGGGGFAVSEGKFSTKYGGGGGGGGRVNAGGGSGGVGSYNGSSGSAGTLTTAGAGGGGYSSGGTYGGAGGAGGNNAASGSSGGGGYSLYGFQVSAGGAGGSPGSAVTGNGNITWVATGTRYGVIA